NMNYKFYLNGWQKILKPLPMVCFPLFLWFETRDNDHPIFEQHDWACI
ncbi:uncharacterized protein METZ01_LOCUS302282, partial [marine metagenome]